MRPVRAGTILTLLGLSLAACGSVPKQPAVERAPVPAAVPSTPDAAAQFASAKPAWALKKGGGYYQDDGPPERAPAGLAERAAALARRAPVVVRPAVVLPHWAQAAAAGFALIAMGTLLMLIGPEKPTRAAQRIVGQTVNAGTSLLDRKDRLVEDVRLLGVVVGTAFEGRLDRVNERVEDYRRMLERRRAEPADSKSGALALPGRVASGFRTGPRGGA